jgi:predicted peptidase
MKNTRTIAPVMAVMCLAALTTLGADSDQPGRQVSKRAKIQNAKTVELEYLLFLPAGYGDEKAKQWPLMLFLHGAGERGSDIKKVAVHGPPKNVAMHPEFPFILVSPQCPEGGKWSSETLLALLNQVEGTYAVDKTRVYLTGLSMGGYGTWELGLKHPERFAAIAPICGGGNTVEALLAVSSQALKSLGVWAFHGAKDQTVPLQESERMVDALKRVGVTDLKLTVYPEAGHDSWTETYNNPDLYTWMLKHQRGSDTH